MDTYLVITCLLYTDNYTHYGGEHLEEINKGKILLICIQDFILKLFES